MEHSWRSSREVSRLIVGLTLPPSFEHDAVRDVGSEFHWARITKVVEVRTESDIAESLMEAVSVARANAGSHGARKFGVSLATW